MNTNEISKLIQEQIAQYRNKTKSKSIGRILSIGDGIAIVFGISDAIINGLVTFPDNSYGLVIHLDEDVISVILLSEGVDLREGDIVQSTGDVIKVRVGDGFLGRIVNGFATPLDGKGKIMGEEFNPIFVVAPGVMARQEISEPLETGVITIDAMIPIGKGQRELIIGDRQTGKTTIAIDTIVNQKGKDVYCVYVAIGQKNSTVTKIYEHLEDEGAMKYTTIVSATASNPVALQFLAPYTAITIAEYWMRQNKNVFIVYDDLSKHAVAYRTISLLLRRPPGREAYPGDIFYLHSSLLERSANVNAANGGGSITAIPIIETQAGDISAYIPTNVISITDGQIFLEQKLFNIGQRPAINCNLSVSRVGQAAQKKFIKKVSSFLKAELAHYFELKSFSQFGSDFDKETKYTLERGEKINELLRQSFVCYPAVMQFVFIVLIKEKIIDYFSLALLQKLKKYLVANLKKTSFYPILKIMDQDNDISDKNFQIIRKKLVVFVYRTIVRWTNKIHDGEQAKQLERFKTFFHI